MGWTNRTEHKRVCVCVLCVCACVRACVCCLTCFRSQRCVCEHVTLTEPALVQNLVLWHFCVQRRSVCVLAAVDPGVLCLSDGCCVWGYGPLRALLLSNLYVVL